MDPDPAKLFFFSKKILSAAKMKVTFAAAKSNIGIKKISL